MRFRHILLYAPDPEAMHRFYTGVLGLQPLEYNADHLVYETGHTRWEFVRKPDATAYHFAFNIPANKGREALEWLRSRTTIYPFEGNELVPFPSWNAEAMYFLDPAGNVVELIARRDLDNASPDPFGPNQWLGMSEIGVPVDAIEPVYERLREQVGCTLYSGNLDVFCAIGDPEGLFIMVDRHRKTWIPVDAPAHPSPFSLELEHQNQNFTLKFNDGHFTYAR